MFRKIPDQKKINQNNNNNNNYSGNTYQNDNNEFVYIDNVNQVLDFRRLSIDTNTTASGMRINGMNNQYSSMKYNGEPSINYGSYSSYSMQMNYPNGYNNSSTINSYDMNDNYSNGYNNANGYNTNGYGTESNFSNANGAIVNENKENTISEWILYNNRQEYYNRVDNNLNFNEYQSNNDGKYYNYSNYTSSNMNSYMKSNFQQIPNSGIQYSGIVNERQSIPYYETLPIPIYTSNTIENNDDVLGDSQAIYDDTTSTIQEKYSLTSKPESSYSMTNPILTSNNSYLYNNKNTPLTIITNNDNDEDESYDGYSSRISESGSKPLLSSYSSTSNYLSNSYTNNSSYNNTTEYKKRVSISSRSSTSQNYPMVVTTSLQSNLNSRHPYSLVIEGSSPLSRQRYNYDYQYQRSVPSTSYYDGTANESNEKIDSSDNENNSKDDKENSDSEKNSDKLSDNEVDHDDDNDNKNNNVNDNGNVDKEKNNSKKSNLKEGKEDENSKFNDDDDNDNDNDDKNKKDEVTDENEDNGNESDTTERKRNEERAAEISKNSPSPSNMLNKKTERFSKQKQNSYKRSSFFSQVVESNNFKCPWPDCDQSFASVTLLNAHEIYSHGTPYPPYPLPQPTYAELADARHRLLWHIKNNISTNPLNIYNSNYCSSVQSPSSSIYSSDSPYAQNSAKVPFSANSNKSSESSNTFTESVKPSKTKDNTPSTEKNSNNDRDKEENEETPKDHSKNETNKNEKEDFSNDLEKQKQNENRIIKKISKIKSEIPHLSIKNVNSSQQNKNGSDDRMDSNNKYTQPLSSSSATMQSLRVQIKVDIKEHLFHYLFTPYIRYSHYTKSYSCFFEGIQGRSIVGEILEDPDWDIRCEDEYSVSYIKMAGGSREAGILFSWERKKVDEWFPPTEDENDRPTLYNDIVTINFVVASTKKR